jgi:SP family general alpha glucoside:H+ symporter-like MFS transporter
MATMEKTEGHVSEHVTSTTGQNIAEDTTAAINNEHNMSVRQSLRFWWKAIVFSFVISLCVVMEGYDTSLMNKFFAFQPFRNKFGDQVDADGVKIVSSRWQTIILNGTQVRMSPALERAKLILTRLDAFSVSSLTDTSPSGSATRRL